MTLIVNEITPRWAASVSDRLVTLQTRNGATPFHAQSNKTVVFHASNAAAVLCYTGSAYIGNTTTDEWIAQQLDPGRPLDTGSRQFAIRLGTEARAAWPNIGFALRRLTHALTAACRTDSTLRTAGVQIIVSGWLWYRNNRARAFMCCILPTQRGDYTILWARRIYGRELLVSAIPNGYLAPAEFEDLRIDLERITVADEAMTRMAQSIRAVSARAATVGPDCMTVTIDHPQLLPEAKISVWYSADPVVPTAGPRIGYSPWIVGPYTCIAPNTMKGGTFTTSFGVYRLEIISPTTIDEDNVAMAIDRQPRPRWP